MAGSMTRTIPRLEECTYRTECRVNEGGQVHRYIPTYTYDL